MTTTHCQCRCNCDTPLVAAGNSAGMGNMSLTRAGHCLHCATSPDTEKHGAK